MSGPRRRDRAHQADRELLQTEPLGYRRRARQDGISAAIPAAGHRTASAGPELVGPAMPLLEADIFPWWAEALTLR